MRFCLLCSLSALLLFSAPSASVQMHPRPPGLQQAEKAETQAEQNIPPPNTHRSPTDMARLQDEADKLAGLAQTIPNDVTSIRNGMLPKNIIEKLKQIEKISKHLRSQLDR